MTPDPIEYRIVRNTLRTLVNAVMVLGDPALQAIAADAATNLQHTSEADTSEMDAYYAAMEPAAEAEAVEF